MKQILSLFLLTFGVFQADCAGLLERPAGADAVIIKDCAEKLRCDTGITWVGDTEVRVITSVEDLRKYYMVTSSRQQKSYLPLRMSKTAVGGMMPLCSGSGLKVFIIQAGYERGGEQFLGGYVYTNLPSEAVRKFDEQAEVLHKDQLDEMTDFWIMPKYLEEFFECAQESHGIHIEVEACDFVVGLSKEKCQGIYKITRIICQTPPTTRRSFRCCCC